MHEDIELRCAPDDSEGLRAEIRRRDRIIRVLMDRAQRHLAGAQSDFNLLQTTFMLEEQVRNRTRELQETLDALGNAKREAEAARYRLSEAIGAISEGFALYDPEDRLIVCNDAFRELWGFRSNPIGREFRDLLSEATERVKPSESGWFARRMQNHSTGTGTAEYRLKDGRILQIRERKTPDGFSVGLYADITELADAQAANAARQQLVDILDFLPDATFAVDQQKKVIAWNRAIERMTGIRKEEIVGKGDYAYGVPFYGEPRPTLLDLIDAPADDIVARYSNVRREGNTLYGEDFVQAAFSGRGAYLGRMASPLLDREGNQVGAIESLRDITAAKQAEADLQSLQEQLRQAAKMEAIGRLGGGIAHDFNNQLTIVQGYCKLLLSKSPCAVGDCGKEVKEILKAAERSAQLTQQLLAFGRKQMLHTEVLDLEEVLTTLRGPLGRMIGEDIEVHVKVAHDLWNVKTDRNQLEQAIINLAINARDAMPTGGALTIEASNAVLDREYVLRHMEASEGEHVCLSVSDTGTGMDEHTRSRVFEPFFTTKPVGVGTGLGLAIVYGFVKQSQGHIELTSEPGQGSCFSLYFPRALDVSVASEAPAETAVSAGTETILVVEDQEALRELTAHILENSGYRVLQAADGPSAIALNRETATIDLALCDVIMPGLSGPDTARQLKLDRPGLKIIYTTGYAERAVLSGLEPGTQVLPKPFTPEALFKVVRHLLDHDVKMAA